MAQPLTVLLDDGVPPGNLEFYTAKVREDIKAEFERLIGELSKLGPTFKFTVSWEVTAAALKAPNLVIIYFRQNPSHTLTSEIPNAPPPTENEAGNTVLDGRRMSEVYVDGNMPAKKLAHIAAHEMMHNKTGFTDQQLHNPPKGGTGIAKSPAEEWHQPDSANAQLFGQFVDTAVPQFMRRGLPT